MKKRVGSLLMALWMMICLCQPVYASEFAQETLDSIVLVYSHIVFEGESLGYSMGTGFFVGKEGENPEYIVTNHHVIEAFLEAGGGKSESSLFIAFDQKHLEEAYVVDYNEEKDLALLHLANPTEERKPLKLEMPGGVGSNVYAVGFPAIADRAVNAVSMYGKEDATVTSGTVNRLLTEEGTGRKVIQMNATIHSGNSGGPLVNADGNVIGVNTFTISSKGVKVEGLNYAVSIEELKPILNRNDVEYDFVEKSEESNESQEMTDGEPVEEVEPAQPVKSGSGSGIMIFLLLFIVLIVVIVMKLKKKKGNIQSYQPSSPQSQNQIGVNQENMHVGKKAMLCSLAPQHRGMRISLENGQVVLGRTSSCQMIFEEGTPGVSRQHCSVYWDTARKEFVLTDMQSTYGTFLANGQKLNPGVSYYLKPGESFYLGERVNEIRTEWE